MSDPRRPIGSALASLACLMHSVAFAQTPSAPAAPAPAAPKFAVQDNSFLIEEAFNQEAGVRQHIFTAQRNGRCCWTFSFTDEWPAGSIRHQVSVTVPWDLDAGDARAGDVLLNYRYQWSDEAPGRAAISPRISAVLPTSSTGRGVGAQLALPVSKSFGRVYLHGNTGATFRRGTRTAPFAGASAVLALTPMTQLLLEHLVVHEDGATTRTISPGLRRGVNAGRTQIVAGAAVPVTFDRGRSASLFLYLSIER